ncbi:HD domain-containing protein [Salidesulfovibrio onnuriiensis]|uniref:HD domain-containing protein n=1 Tax=Salidesulfovibrio onnuriiensis TaxID=2583823 RepID=UPI0011C77D51|nr:HD domain-containing protein [Salidesulfovibrio onnuriiensis]
MTDTYDRIWEAALPYQDKRDDAGHAYVTYTYAQELLQLAPGTPEVVLPAIIMHDTGWSKLSREERFVIFQPGTTPEDELAVRYRHQDEGVKIAHAILEDLRYDAKWTSEILEIISEHDTRDHFISLDEGLVRDADKLWRFSEIGFRADIERFEFDPGFLHDKIEAQIDKPGFFYSDAARELARRELAARREQYGILLRGMDEAVTEISAEEYSEAAV